MVPSAVRSLALVTPAVPRESFRADASASLAAVFDRYASLCQAEHALRTARIPDLAGMYARVYRGSAIHPRVVRSSSGLGSAGQLMNVEVQLDGGHIAQALAAVFEGDAAGLPLLPQGIEHPDDNLDAEIAASEEYPFLLPHFPWGGYLSLSATTTRWSNWSMRKHRTRRCRFRGLRRSRIRLDVRGVASSSGHRCTRRDSRGTDLCRTLGSFAEAEHRARSTRFYPPNHSPHASSLHVPHN